MRVTRQTLWGIALCAISACVAGCSSSITAPTNSAPYAQADLQVGAGAAAQTGDALVVSYTGWFYDSTQPSEKGAQFDTSTGTLFSFTLGSDQVITGWNQGIVGMHVGGVRRLVIPPSLAYGGTRHGIIPPNATLVFEITLAADTSRQ